MTHHTFFDESSVVIEVITGSVEAFYAIFF
jgi:hypothetical protein